MGAGPGDPGSSDPGPGVNQMATRGTGRTEVPLPLRESCPRPDVGPPHPSAPEPQCGPLGLFPWQTPAQARRANTQHVFPALSRALALCVHRTTAGRSDISQSAPHPDSRVKKPCCLSASAPKRTLACPRPPGVLVQTAGNLFCSWTSGGRNRESSSLSAWCRCRCPRYPFLSP